MAKRPAHQAKFLIKFWIAWKHEPDKIALLRYWGRQNWGGHSTREEFEQSGIRHRRRCAVCRDKASHRHHIIQLSRGGQNIPENVISLCRYCHRLVHASHKPVRFKPSPRKLGAPRLVKKARIRPADTESSSLPDGAPPTLTGLELAPAQS